MESKYRESKKGKTPNGGVRSEIFYMDNNFNAVDKDKASMAMIHELDENGRMISETIGFLDRKSGRS